MAAVVVNGGDGLAGGCGRERWGEREEPEGGKMQGVLGVSRRGQARRGGRQHEAGGGNLRCVRGRHGVVLLAGARR